MSCDVLPKSAADILMGEVERLNDSANSIMRFLDHKLFHEKVDSSNAKESLLELKLFWDDHLYLLDRDGRMSSILAAHCKDDVLSPSFLVLVEELINYFEGLLPRIANGYFEMARIKERSANLILYDLSQDLEIEGMKRTLHSWVASGVVPYFDLRAWERINNQVLTGDEKAMLLAKNDPRSISQTTEVHFKKLFETSFAHSLLNAYLSA